MYVSHAHKQLVPGGGIGRPLLYRSMTYPSYRLCFQNTVMILSLLPLYCTVLHRTVLYHTVLYRTVLYCIGALLYVPVMYAPVHAGPVML